MFNIHTEMASGAISRGYDRATEEEATDIFAQVVAQVRTWKKFTIDVIMSDEGKEIKREHISNE